MVVQTHLQRGKFLWSSEKATVAAAPTWDRNQRACEFKVEALEASGTLRCVTHDEGERIKRAEYEESRECILVFAAIHSSTYNRNGGRCGF